MYGAYDFGLLDDNSECFFENDLVLDSSSRSLSAFSSEPSSPESSVASCVSPYDDPYVLPSGSVTIAVQPEFGQVQSVPLAMQTPIVTQQQQCNLYGQALNVPDSVVIPQYVTNPFVSKQETEPRGEKKRKREGELSAILPPDMLLKISSKEFEEKQRPLTQAEQLEVQRQRKKVRNREYAQNCRSKKKQLLESVQEANDRLTQEKTELHNALLEVQRDNQRLLYENSQMKILLSSLGYSFATTAMAPPASLQTSPAPPFVTPMQNMSVNVMPTVPPTTTTPPMTTINFSATDNTSYLPLNYSTPTLPMANIMGKSTPGLNYNPFAPQSPLTTICLFAIIFSFGFFFGGSMGNIIPGFGASDKLVVEARGRSLFETEGSVPTQVDGPTVDASDTPTTITPQEPPATSKLNCTETGKDCDPPAETAKEL